MPEKAFNFIFGACFGLVVGLILGGMIHSYDLYKFKWQAVEHSAGEWYQVCPGVREFRWKHEYPIDESE